MVIPFTPLLTWDAGMGHYCAKLITNIDVPCLVAYFGHLVLVACSGGIGGVQIIKLGQEYISAHTSNQNPKYAKAGDIWRSMVPQVTPLHPILVEY